MFRMIAGHIDIACTFLLLYFTDGWALVYFGGFGSLASAVPLSSTP
jgi:hypothetical protein